jgi:hypothetical protein
MPEKKKQKSVDQLLHDYIRKDFEKMIEQAKRGKRWEYPSPVKPQWRNYAMTKKQRILDKVKYIKRNYALGAARTTQLNNLRQKYEISSEHLKKICLGVGGADYWN